MSLVFIRKLSTTEKCEADLTLALTAEERTRSRHKFQTPEGQTIFLQLDRGTVLYDNDLLQSDGDIVLRIVAKPEPVLTVKAPTPRDLLRGAYHLGNRHVPLEITQTCLRLAPDSVLRNMLEQLGMEVIEEMHPFQPEAGAYGQQGHRHSHPH